MSVDIGKNKYTVKAILKTGEVLDITGALLQLTWQDPAEEIAQRATLRLAQAIPPVGGLHSVMKILTIIVIYANGEEVFRGVVWEWAYSTNNQGRIIELTCYDHFIYAKNSDFYAYYPAGKSTKDIISDICAKNGIPLKYEYDSITHAKTKCDPFSVADHIFDILDEARRKLSSVPVVIYDKGTLIIKKRGSNSTIYFFEAKKSAIGTTERITLNGLVTKAVILGKEDKDGRCSVEATKDGKLEYGNLQRYIYRDSNNTIDSAQKEAQNLLNEKGNPEHYITLDAPDVPALRKGDKIRVHAGSISGFFYVNGVTHNATSRTMTMELEKIY